MVSYGLRRAQFITFSVIVRKMRDDPNGTKAWAVKYDIYLFISLFVTDARGDLFASFPCTFFCLYPGPAGQL